MYKSNILLFPIDDKVGEEPLLVELIENPKNNVRLISSLLSEV